MATSRPELPAWFGSAAHYLGSGGAGVGLLVALLAHTGGWGVVVVGGLYGAGAVLGVTLWPDRPPSPPSPPPPGPGGPGEPAAELRRELSVQERRVALAGWPEPDARTARELLHAVGARIDPGTAVQLQPVVRVVVPAELDWYERSSSWWRWDPQGPPPGAEFAARVRLVLERLP